MKLLNTVTAAVTGGIAALGAGVVLGAPAAQADLPPGSYWCWSHLVPQGQQCPAIPPWGSRWTECPGSQGGLFTLDHNDAACNTASYKPNELYTFNCWDHEMRLGDICPPVRPQSNAWIQCGSVYVLNDADCY